MRRIEKEWRAWRASKEAQGITLTRSQWLALRSLSRAKGGILWGATTRQDDRNLNGTTAGHLAHKGLIELAPEQRGKATAYRLSDAGRKLLGGDS
jgi:DNA-binding MarR family transcriptional regulator